MPEGRSSAAQCVFSVDVEDWFHILDLSSTPPLRKWDSLPSRVERNFLVLLDVFSEYNARVTCFFLGWIADRFPQLVREALARGHEIASHGYAHELAFRMSREQFAADAGRSRDVLEQISGQPVLGYRAAGFSVIQQTPWFFEELENAGYAYDSSVFPARRNHGGLESAPRLPHRVAGTSLIEFPMSVSDFLGRPTCFFGGGYLRLFPKSLILGNARKLLAKNMPVFFYVHPREIDPEHPRLPMPAARHFRSYVNLRSTEPKLRAILKTFPMTTFSNYLQREFTQEKAGAQAAYAV